MSAVCFEWLCCVSKVAQRLPLQTLGLTSKTELWIWWRTVLVWSDLIESCSLMEKCDGLMQRCDGEVWWRDGLMKRCVSVIERCDWHCGLTTTTLHLLLRESANNAWLWQVTTVDRYQGQQNDYILLSLVRTRTVGHLRSVTSVSFFLCYTVSHNKCCNCTDVLRCVMFMTCVTVS